MALKAKRAIPDRILNAPSLNPGLEIYYIGFMDLMASRQIGFGAGPIWWITVQQYCEAKGLDEAQTEEMHFHIRNMDGAYLRHTEKSSKGANRPIQQKHSKKK